MRLGLIALLLLAGCADRPLSDSSTSSLSDVLDQPPCGMIGERCCYLHNGCDTDPDTGKTVFTDCVSLPGEESQGVCVPYGECGNPNNVCCDGGLCEYGWRCGAEGRCVPAN